MTWGLVAIGGASLIGGGISAITSANATKTATKAAADANTYSSDQTLEAQKENNALAKSIYDQNTTALSPFRNQGVAANANINALLGLDPDNGEADAAFNKYLDSSGYKFQLDQGNKAVTAGAAATGALKSGATLKALQDRGQNIGAGYFSNYLNTLIGQQGVGLNATTAQAGVGTNYSGQVANQNNTTANSLATGANNVANVTGNAALAGAANTNSFVNNLLGTAGYVYGKTG